MWGLWLVGFLLLVIPPFVRVPKPPDAPAEGEKHPFEKEPSVSSEYLQLDQALREHNPDALLTFFSNRPLAPSERSRVERLIRDLGDSAFRTRAGAADDLERIGPRIAGMLRRYSHDPDTEIASRCRQLLQRLLPQTKVTLVADGLRRLGRSKNPEIVRVLMAYLPDAETDALANEVQRILSEIGIHDSKANAVLVEALTDALPEKRHVAGILLAPLEEHRPAVRKLLDDPSSRVRLPVAHALLGQGEKAAIPVLIHLLPSLEPIEAWPVLDELYRVGGFHTPAVPLGRGEAARERCRQAWLEWWNKEKDHLNRHTFARETAKQRTLIVQMELRSQRGEVTEIDESGAIKLTIADLTYPVWAVSLLDQRWLVVEYLADRVTVRERDASIGQHFKAQKPVYAALLRDGRIFVACRDALYEFAGSGTPRDLMRWPERIVATARRCRDGQTLVLTEGGTCLFLDSSMKETRRFDTGCQLVLAPGIDVTANNRVLIPDHAANRVVEFSPTGEILWEAEVTNPTSVQRLPDGNTLVASTKTREVIELDRIGRIVRRISASPSGSSLRPVVALRLAR
jgi:HEAT repeat protein